MGCWFLASYQLVKVVPEILEGLKQMNEANEMMEKRVVS